MHLVQAQRHAGLQERAAVVAVSESVHGPDLRQAHYGTVQGPPGAGRAGDHQGAKCWLNAGLPQSCAVS